MVDHWQQCTCVFILSDLPAICLPLQNEGKCFLNCTTANLPTFSPQFLSHRLDHIRNRVCRFRGKRFYHLDIDRSDDSVGKVFEAVRLRLDSASGHATWYLLTLSSGEETRKFTCYCCADGKDTNGNRPISINGIHFSIVVYEYFID